jgi:hypothetical protein
MTAFSIVFIVLGALLILGGVLLQPLWRATVRPLYRNPEAQEPSVLGWGVRSGIMILSGLVVIVVSIGLLGQGVDAQPSPSEAAAERCSAFVDEVGSPDSPDEVDEAVSEAADGAGFDVDRRESTDSRVADLPSGEVTITVETTTWTVRDGGETVATFGWTAADNVPGRFRAGDCS